MPKSRRSGSSSMTAIFNVCICTFGVSLYSSTASQPLSRFTAVSPSWRDRTFGARSNNLFGGVSGQRQIAVDLVEEQPDCSGHRTGAGAVDQIEAVAGTGQLHIADRRMRHRPQPLDKTAGLRDRDHVVVAAVNDE